MPRKQQDPLVPSVTVPLIKSKKDNKRNATENLSAQKRLKKIIEEAKQILQEEESEDDEIPYPETEMLDVIVRTRKATQLIMSKLPKLDKADENRLARAMEPIPEIHPK